MTTFIWCSAKNFGGKKWHQNNTGSNRQEETSLGPLLLTIKVIYIILKKFVDKLTSQARNTHDMHWVLL
jgi:hypothetical protein